MRADGSPEPDNYVQRQQEFPSWIENREYLIHGSPTNTLISRLGSTNKRVSAPAAFDIFAADGSRLSHATLRRSSTSDDVEDRLKSTRIDMDNPQPKHVVIEIKINGKPPSQTVLKSDAIDDDEVSQATRL